MAIVGILQAYAQLNPPAINYITYLPAASATQIAFDSAGYAYVAGIYFNSQVPCTWPLGSPSIANPISFVTKLKPNGDGVIWTICMPGLSAAVAVDGSGSVYIASDANGSSNISKLSPIDGKIIYSTLIASSTPSAIVVDRAGSAYVTGAAKPGFLSTPGAYQSSLNCSSGDSNCTDAFVVKLSTTGATQYATFAGGTGGSKAIAVDSRGQVWITGTSGGSVAKTYSGLSYRITSSFILKLDSTGGKRLVSRGFGGGLAFQQPTSAAGYGIAIDSKDAAYAVGATELYIQTTPGVIQPTRTTNWGVDIGYIAKFDSAGNTVYASYIGGNGEGPLSVAVDALGNAYFSLSTRKADLHCGSHPKLTVLSADASKILVESAVAGLVTTIALDGNGTLYAAGGTGSSVFLATANAYMTQYPGGSNAAFVAKVDFSKPAGPRVNCVVNAASLAAGNNPFGPDGSIAPGEIITVFGEGFTPGPDLNVTFDGKRAPILYADNVQINAIVPFQVASGNPLTLVSVNNASTMIGGFNLPVAPASPGIFTNNGQLAALNEDGSINSTLNPAKPGSVISLFMTGVGAYNMKIADGDLGPLVAPFPTVALDVAARLYLSGSPPFSGQLMEVLFAGQAPGQVAGLAQVNLRIPENAQPGLTGIIVYVGNYSTANMPGRIAIR